MSAFTPGPWAVIAAQRGYIVTANDGTYDIAVIRDIGRHDNGANARLISAAPLMLEALERAEPQLIGGALLAVRAAIRAARGEA
jgi:hypothetical protein